MKFATFSAELAFWKVKLTLPSSLRPPTGIMPVLLFTIFSGRLEITARFGLN
jgi:hypothetical protein